ncbi:NAD-dependent epimerase/dehydratase family protein [Sinimarinibacterium thermocellulolyticum]|uniref:NAD-dependent epimerase/dehydratase family protein n=1 Tax=Sinimarinibacterium thermocellulolyticum TaxID=3170016 RepID=A0ABV2AA22_9GAMM
MATVFVTGGSGYVGRNLIRHLLARGDRVRALVRSASSAALVQGLGAEPVHGDLHAVDAMHTGMRDCAAVFHCAALVDEWGDKAAFQRINVDGTRHVIEAARAAGVPVLVHVSTEAVLADGTPIIDADETRPLPAHPLPRYPATKAEAERLVRAADGDGLRTVIVRPRLIWGNDDSSVLSKLEHAVNAGRFMWVDGGRYPTSTCHVDNLCEALLLAAEKGRCGEAYFVTDGEPVELRGFFTAMLRTRGVDAGERCVPHGVALALATVGEKLWELLRLKSAPPATRMAVRLIGEPVTVRDDKARRELGYVGRITREQGLSTLRRPQGGGLT